LEVFRLVLNVAVGAFAVVRQITALHQLALACRGLALAVHELVAVWTIGFAATNICSCLAGKEHLVIEGCP